MQWSLVLSVGLGLLVTSTAADHLAAKPEVSAFDYSGVACLRGSRSTGNPVSYTWKLFEGTCDFTPQVGDEICCENTSAFTRYLLIVTNANGDETSATVQVDFGTYLNPDEEIQSAKVRNILARLKGEE